MSFALIKDNIKLKSSLALSLSTVAIRDRQSHKPKTKGNRVVRTG